MDFFDRARKAFGDIAQSASTGGRFLQIQAELGQLEVDKDYQEREAGRLARQLFTRRVFQDQEFEVLVGRLQEIDQKMEVLRAEMNQVQAEGVPGGPPRCATCGRDLAEEDRFCRGCGATVPPPRG